MNKDRRKFRQLDWNDDDYRHSPDNGTYRSSTIDSGRGSMLTSERSSRLSSRTTNASLSPFSLFTPINNSEIITPDQKIVDKPVRIDPTPIVRGRRYQQAFVSHVDHPSAFFLQLPHKEKEYSELNQKINAFYSTNSKADPSKSWKLGEYCIAKFYDDGLFYRARIIATPTETKNSDQYGVVYVDYGNWEKIARDDIHPLLPQFADLPAQAIACSLTKTLPRSQTWDKHPKAVEFFERLVKDKHVDATFELRTSKDCWPLHFVKLELSSNKRNVRELMNEEGHIREELNEKIYPEFNCYLKRVDCLIYDIPFEDEEINNDDYDED